jgi:hypothetical protein
MGARAGLRGSARRRSGRARGAPRKTAPRKTAEEKQCLQLRARAHMEAGNIALWVSAFWLRSDRPKIFKLCVLVQLARSGRAPPGLAPAALVSLHTSGSQKKWRWHSNTHGLASDASSALLFWASRRRRTGGRRRQRCSTGTHPVLPWAWQYAWILSPDEVPKKFTCPIRARPARAGTGSAGQLAHIRF